MCSTIVNVIRRYIENISILISSSKKSLLSTEIHVRHRNGDSFNYYEKFSINLSPWDLEIFSHIRRKFAQQSAEETKHEYIQDILGI